MDEKEKEKERARIQAEMKRLEGLVDQEATGGTELPPLANLGMDIITKVTKQFKRRWGYRSSKRKDKAVIKMSKLEAHFKRQENIESDNDLKAYIHRNNTELRIKILNRIYAIISSILAPVITYTTVRLVLSGG